MINFYHNICKITCMIFFQGFSRALIKFFFFNSRSRVGKIEILDQGLSRFNLDKPWSSRQVRGQLFQGQGLSFKDEYSIFIQGFFKGNPWNSSKFKATSRGTFSRILQPLFWIWGKGILRLHYAHYVHFVKQNNIMHFISILSRKTYIMHFMSILSRKSHIMRFMSILSRKSYIMCIKSLRIWGKGIVRLHYALYVQFVKKK